MKANTAMVIISITYYSVLAVIACAGVWKFGEGGGWLILIAFIMSDGFKVKLERRDAD